MRGPKKGSKRAVKGPAVAVEDAPDASGSFDDADAPSSSGSFDAEDFTAEAPEAEASGAEAGSSSTAASDATGTEPVAAAAAAADATVTVKRRKTRKVGAFALQMPPYAMYSTPFNPSFRHKPSIP